MSRAVYCTHREEHLGLVLVWEGLAAHEEHVLEEVREALSVRWVRERADSDAQRRRRRLGAALFTLLLTLLLLLLLVV
eukprot:SAG25_NODE_292_length_10289_cov_21.085770_1_plen_77_part_10